MPLFDKIEHPLRELLAKRGYRLIEICNGDFPGAVRVVIYSDKGIAHSDCDAVAGLIREELNEAVDVDLNAVAFEITSPGLYRKLKNIPVELEAFSGRPVSLVVRKSAVEEGICPGLENTGTIRQVSEGAVTLESSDNRETVIPLDMIVSAKLQG